MKSILKIAVFVPLFAFYGVSFTCAAQADESDKELTKKITDCLMDVKKIKVGMTRNELFRLFTVEGGLSTAGWRTYVYKKCEYIKVDVEFNPQDSKKESSSDIITKISRPYLEWSVQD